MLIQDGKISGLYKSPPCQPAATTASNILINGFPKIILHPAAKQDVCELKWDEMEAKPVVREQRIKAPK